MLGILWSAIIGNPTKFIKEEPKESKRKIAVLHGFPEHQENVSCHIAFLESIPRKKCEAFSWYDPNKREVGLVRFSVVPIVEDEEEPCAGTLLSSRNPEKRKTGMEKVDEGIDHVSVHFSCTVDKEDSKVSFTARTNKGKSWRIDINETKLTRFWRFEHPKNRPEIERGMLVLVIFAESNNRQKEMEHPNEAPCVIVL